MENGQLLLMRHLNYHHNFVSINVYWLLSKLLSQQSVQIPLLAHAVMSAVLDIALGVLVGVLVILLTVSIIAHIYCFVR